VGLSVGVLLLQEKLSLMHALGYALLLTAITLNLVGLRATAARSSLSATSTR